MFRVMEIVLPVFLVIGLGYGIRRIGLVNKDFFVQVNRLIFYVCLPLLLFYKISTADFSASFNFKLVLATSFAVACCFLFAYLLGYLGRFTAPVHGAFCQGSFRGNLAYIGLAIVYNAYGDAGLTGAGILLGFLVPVLNFFAILALTLPGHKQHNSPLEIIRQIIYNPLILASLAGILWSFFRLPMPTVLDRTLAVATGMTLPLALLAIGDSFSLEKIRGDIGKAGLAVALKLILLPLVTAGFMITFGITGLDFGIGLLMAGAPTAVATYIMACSMGGDGDLAGTIVIMATGFSALSYTLLLLCLQLYGI